MTARQLAANRVIKPWGRRTLTDGFDPVGNNDGPVGEVWFGQGDAAAPLLAKYLFTSERLSIQVHPDDTAARAAGYPRGKDEAWMILAAEAGATVALGPKHPTSRAALHAAAADGTIESLLEWRPVMARDAIYSPAGTVHALGAGLTLIEIQQNVDLTYRLYDYGRPRALSLDAGIAAACLEPCVPAIGHLQTGAGRHLIASGAAFTVEQWKGGSHHVSLDGAGTILVPIAGSGRIDGQPFRAGQCWSLSDDVAIELDDESDILIAYPPEVVPSFK